MNRGSKIFLSTPFELVNELDMCPSKVLSILNRQAKLILRQPTNPLQMLSDPLETGMSLLDETLRGGFTKGSIMEYLI
jgi:hypothetical protein